MGILRLFVTSCVQLLSRIAFFLDRASPQIRRTLCDLCAVSERRRVGLVAGRLPANLTLAATFRRPQLPANVVTRFEKVCDLVRV